MARELLKDLIYGEQLVSAGCKVDFAVGLTYSLNLEAMLTVPLAFGDLGELDNSVKLSPAFLLEGIRRKVDFEKVWSAADPLNSCDKIKKELRG